MQKPGAVVMPISLAITDSRSFASFPLSGGFATPFTERGAADP